MTNKWNGKNGWKRSDLVNSVSTWHTVHCLQEITKRRKKEINVNGTRKHNGQSRIKKWLSTPVFCAQIPLRTLTHSTNSDWCMTRFLQDPSLLVCMYSGLLDCIPSLTHCIHNVWCQMGTRINTSGYSSRQGWRSHGFKGTPFCSLFILSSRLFSFLRRHNGEVQSMKLNQRYLFHWLYRSIFQIWVR